jgi:hypothetical protein
MKNKAQAAILYTHPDTLLQDYECHFEHSQPQGTLS